VSCARPARSLSTGECPRRQQDANPNARAAATRAQPALECGASHRFRRQTETCKKQSHPPPCAATKGDPKRRRSPHSKGAPHRSNAGACPLKIVRHLDAVGGERVHCFHHCRRGLLFEPRSAAPGILIRHRHKSVLDGILVHVMEACKVALFKSDSGLPVVAPNPAVLLLILCIDPCGAVLMEIGNKAGQRGGTRIFSVGAVTNEMVVVGKNSPSIEMPLVFPRISQKAVTQDTETVRSIKDMLLPVGAGSDNKTPPFSKSVRRGMSPSRANRIAHFTHSKKSMGPPPEHCAWCLQHPCSKAIQSGEDRRTPKALRAGATRAQPALECGASHRFRRQTETCKEQSRPPPCAATKGNPKRRRSPHSKGA